MAIKVAIIGAPTSAGAYGPGQEKAPGALRDVALVERLGSLGIECVDLGDVSRFRWRADRADPRAMNKRAVRRVAEEVCEKVSLSMDLGCFVLVLGGDCTVELGTVAGALKYSGSVGLIYFDLDTDMNTPETTNDGALEWMGVAHLLGLPGFRPEIVPTGFEAPMLLPSAVCLFAAGNIKPAEQQAIDRLAIKVVPKALVQAHPQGAIRQVAEWAGNFDVVLVHLDVDVMDFEDFPLAENTRRKVGLPFVDVIATLESLVAIDNVRALTICEINPDHGDEDGSTIEQFADALADVLATLKARRT